MRIGLVAGETSGDLLGAGLIKAVLQHYPDCQFEGVAGPAMRAAGCDVWEDAEVLALFGLIEPLREIPRLLRLRRSLVQRWSENPPDVFIGIDAPDFNLGLEERLHDRGIKTIHYVSPSVWAWRQGRVRKVARAVDKVLCLLPFEKSFYDKHDVAADFVGHPLADDTPTDLDSHELRRQLGIDTPLLLAVLPGSRHSEVSRLGPVFAAACARLATTYADIQFVTPMVNDKLKDIFAAHLEDAGIRERFLLTDGGAQTAMAASDLILLAAGTATLQAALLRKPMVAAYRFAPLTYAIAKVFKLVNLPFFSLPNLLTDKPLVPEYLQSAANPEALATALAELIESPDKRAAIAAEFSVLRDELAQGANQRAAAAVIKLALSTDNVR